MLMVCPSAGGGQLSLPPNSQLLLNVLVQHELDGSLSVADLESSSLRDFYFEK
jgi:hypothetical protein